MDDDRRLERNSPPENKVCDYGLCESILVECLKPDAVTSDSIKSYFQKPENGGECDVSGVIYPFRGNKKQAVVIFPSPESASRVCSKSHTEYTIKPLKTPFSKVCATIDKQQWPLLESARDEIVYEVLDVIGACMAVEGSGSDSMRTVVGTQLQIEEVDRVLTKFIEKSPYTVQQRSSADVSNLPSTSAQDLTNQVASNDEADTERLPRNVTAAGTSNSQMHLLPNAASSNVTSVKSNHSVTLQYEHVSHDAEARREVACSNPVVLPAAALLSHLQGHLLKYPHLQALLNDEKSETFVLVKNPSPDLIAKGGSELESFVADLTALAHSGRHGSTQFLPQHFQTSRAAVPSGLPEAAFEFCSTTIHVYKGDLTTIRVNAIVNPANSKLLNGGGAALAIAEAAGKEFDDLCRDYILRNEKLPTGKAVRFQASGRLLQCGIEHIINCVGPDYYYYSDNNKCREMLAMTVLNCLEEAEDHRCASVAMPAISSGIYGVPLPICTAAYFDGVCSFLSKKRPQYVRDIHFVDLSEDMCNAIREEFARRLPHFLQGIASRNPETRSATSSTSYSDDKEVPWWENPLMANGTSVSTSRATNAPYFHDDTYVWQRTGSPNPWAANNGQDARSTSSSAVAIEVKTAAQPSLTAGAAVSVVRLGSSAADRSMDSTPPASAAARSSHIVNDAVELLSRSDDLKCPICLEIATDAKSLPCSHTFCSACVNHPDVQRSALCPVCRVPFGTSQGYQPPGGTMNTNKLARSLPGYERSDTIEICYHIPNGIQNANHPNPGRTYTGTTRTAYLPDNPEGREVLRLLKDAFNRGLTFTIGTSHTTGQKDCVVWNDIHHKTVMYGGPEGFGYPDPHYLKRVKEELAAKGVF